MLTFYMVTISPLTQPFLSIDHAELDLEGRGTESTDFCYMHPILRWRRSALGSKHSFYVLYINIFF